MFETAHLAGSRASSAALELVGVGLRKELLMQPGMREAFTEAVAVDPGFGYGYAGLAALDFLFGRAPHQRLDAALAATDRATDRERATIGLVDAYLHAPPERRLELARAHLASHPRDILAIVLAVTAVDRGVRGPGAAVDLLEPLLPAHRGHWWLKGVLATWLVDVRRLRTAWQLTQQSLDEEPAAWHAAHAFAHLTYTTDEHTFGAGWLTSWQERHRPRGYPRAHLAWHVALGRLATGDSRGAAKVMLDAMTIASPDLGTDAIELATTSWLCLAEGDPALGDRVRGAVRTTPGRLVALSSPARAVAAGMLLCGAGCRPELAELAGLCARADRPVYREVVLPVLDACAGLLDGDPGAVAVALAGLGPEAIARLGGSNTEQDVLERCLLFALQQSRAAAADRG